jgi:hypothetical protein
MPGATSKSVKHLRQNSRSSDCDVNLGLPKHTVLTSQMRPSLTCIIYKMFRCPANGSYLFITQTHAQFYNIITSPLYVFRHSECHPQGVTVLKADYTSIV